MSNKLIEIGVIVGALVVGFTTAIALESSKQPDGEMVDGDMYYDAQGERGNRFSDYAARDTNGSFTTTRPLNLGGRRSNKKNKRNTKRK